MKIRAGLTCIAMILAVVLMEGCSTKPAAQDSPSAAVANPDVHAGPVRAAVAVGKPGEEVAAAKELMKRIASAKSLSDIEPYLTNESCFIMAVVLTIPVSMAVGMQDMDPKANKELGKKYKAEFDAIQKKYGMDSKTPPPDQASMDKFLAQGRQLFKDLDDLLNRMTKDGVIKEKDAKPDPGKLIKAESEASYEVISPTKVKITPKDPKEKPIEARVEEGQWRLHLGGLNDLKPAPPK